MKIYHDVKELRIKLNELDGKAKIDGDNKEAFINWIKFLQSKLENRVES